MAQCRCDPSMQLPTNKYIDPIESICCLGHPIQAWIYASWINEQDYTDPWDKVDGAGPMGSIQHTTSMTLRIRHKGELQRILPVVHMRLPLAGELVSLFRGKSSIPS